MSLRLLTASAMFVTMTLSDPGHSQHVSPSFQDIQQMNSAESRTVLGSEFEGWGPCPKTLEEWKRWRRVKFMDLLSKKAFTGARTVDGKLRLNAATVKDFLDNCSVGQEAIHALPEFRACFERILKLEKIASDFRRLEDATTTKTRQVEGFPETYKAEKLHRLATALGKLDHEPSAGQAEIRDLTAGAAEVRAVVLDSAIIPGLKSFVLLDLRADGEQFWTHFEISNNTFVALSVSVIPSKNSGKPVAGFQRHSIESNDELRRTALDPQTCLQCHRTAPISLVAKNQSKTRVVFSTGSQDGKKLLAEMNEKIEGVALAVPAGNSIEDIGAPRGPSIHRSVEYLRRLAEFSSTPAVSDTTLLRLAPMMNCVSCHDSKTVALTIGHQPLASDVFNNYVLNGHMPPKNGLSRTDQLLLSELIEREYFGGYRNMESTGIEWGILGKWLNESCAWTREQTELSGVKRSGND